MNHSITILAIGAAGPFAGLVVPELAKRDAKVRGLIRHAEQAEAVLKNGAAEIAIGDLSDVTSMNAALQGVDGVFYIAPAGVANEVEVGKTMVAAAKAAGVRRFVFSALIDPIISAMPHHFAKVPVEEAILASGMEFTVLQPTMFFQNIGPNWKQVEQSGVFAQPWSAETPFSWVDFRDVAEVAAIALLEDRLLAGTFELCAPGHLNRHDLAALMGEVLGKQIAVGRIPIGKGTSPMQPMFDWYDHHGLMGNSLVLSAILGREPRTMRAYLEGLAAKPPVV